MINRAVPSQVETTGLALVDNKAVRAGAVQHLQGAHLHPSTHALHDKTQGVTRRGAPYRTFSASSDIVYNRQRGMPLRAAGSAGRVLDMRLAAAAYWSRACSEVCQVFTLVLVSTAQRHQFGR